MTYTVAKLDKRIANALVVQSHYLHRRPPNTYSFGLFDEAGVVQGVVIFGTPASRHLQKSAVPSDPSLVIELNRLWVDDSAPRNSASFFVSRALAFLPPRVIVSYADTAYGHSGIVYRALNFHYAGWTDMDRKTPRYDYIPPDGTQHTREAFRNGVAHYVRRSRRRPKAKYWTVTGNRRDRHRLTALVGWPSLSWDEFPVPIEHQQVSI